MKNIQYYGLLLSILLLGACSPQVPENAILQQTQVSISPDYNDLVIPCNIAPLNFKINEQAESYITRIYSHKGKEMVLAAIHRYLPQKSRQRMGEIPTAEKQSGGGDRSLYILPVDRTVLCGI